MGSSEEVKERERDADGTEMPKASRAALIEVMEYLELEAQRRKSSAMASGRERDVVGEMEEKDEFNQIEEYLNRALMLIKVMEEKDEVNQIEEYLNKALKALPLIKICKKCTAMSSAVASGRTQIQAPESDTKDLQLHLSSSLPDIFYTGERKLGSEIHVELIDNITGNVVTSGPESCAKLNVVVVKGNFDNNDRTREAFRDHVVTDRDEKKKLLTGAVELVLENGVALLPVPTFTDNSSWIPNREIRLGVEVESGFWEGIRVREAISNPFVVIDRRGKGNEKHYPPAPDDEVWRLRNIGRKGEFHKRLNAAGISKVRHIFWKLYNDPQGLMEILETKMTTGRWDDLVNHAKTCVLSGKYYVYYADATKNFGVVFENVFELCGLIEGGEYCSAEDLSDSQKVSAANLIIEARDNECDRWKNIVEYHVPMPSGMKPSKSARFSLTDGATGAHTDQQVRWPAIGDPAVPFDQQVLVPGQPPSYPYFNRGQYSKGVHFLIAGDGPATSSDPSEQANGNTALPVEDDFFNQSVAGSCCGFLGSKDVRMECGSSSSVLSENCEPGDMVSVLSGKSHIYYPNVLADNLKKKACAEWKDIVEYNGPPPLEMNPSKRARFSQTDEGTFAPESCPSNLASSSYVGPPVNPGQDIGAPVPCQPPSVPSGEASKSSMPDSEGLIYAKLADIVDLQLPLRDPPAQADENSVCSSGLDAFGREDDQSDSHLLPSSLDLPEQANGNKVVWANGNKVLWESIGNSANGNNVVWGINNSANGNNVMWGSIGDSANGNNVVWGSIRNSANGIINVGCGSIGNSANGNNMVWGSIGNAAFNGEDEFEDQYPDIFAKKSVSYREDAGGETSVEEKDFSSDSDFGFRLSGRRRLRLSGRRRLRLAAFQRLSGRQRPVHKVFGGGKLADVFLWRNKKISAAAAVIGGATAIWVLFELLEYHLTFVCYCLILSLAILFLWSNATTFINKSPRRISEITIPEDTVVNIALAIRFKINRAFGVLRDIASGWNLCIFLAVGLLVLSIVGPWCNFFTVFFIAFVILCLFYMRSMRTKLTPSQRKQWLNSRNSGLCLMLGF